jgi:hypothetical protein
MSKDLLDNLQGEVDAGHRNKLLPHRQALSVLKSDIEAPLSDQDGVAAQ